MYKTIFLKYQNGFFKSNGGGKDILLGKTEELDKLINGEYDNGWELVTMVPVSHGEYLLIFKKRSN